MTVISGWKGSVMKKKILALSILSVFMLVSISLGTVGGSESTKSTESKESPLYRIRNNQAKSNNVNNLLKGIKAKFLGERIFFIPSKLMDELCIRYFIRQKEVTLGLFCTSSGILTCDCTVFPSC